MGRIGQATLAKAQELYSKNNKLTKEDIAKKLGLSVGTIEHCWGKITGVTRKHGSKIETIKKAKDILRRHPTYQPTEIAKILNITRSYIISLWESITGEPYSRRGHVQYVSSASENVPVMLQIPSFVPKVKNGNDVSEFFGIVENGGECYKDVRFKIPEGEFYDNWKSIGKYV